MNTASRRVLAKVGFTETERKELDPVYGNSLLTTRRLGSSPGTNDPKSARLDVISRTRSC
jgi:hypothetical protein